MRFKHGVASMLAVAIGLSAGSAWSAQSNSSNDDSRGSKHGRHVKHVLLISVDGMHERDLANCIAGGTCLNLAMLAGNGIQYTAATTTTPSDSFPGLLAMVTGGTPRTTGVYYDDSYDRTYFAPNDTTCSIPGGIEAVFDESIEFDDSQIFGGGGINPDNLPRHLVHGVCKPVYPHEFVKVNTVFEVIRAAGHYTAWSDKHFAYDIVNGPSGKGVNDLYTPEVNSDPAKGGVVNGVQLTDSKAKCDGTTNSLPLSKVTDYTTCIPTVEAYDDTKVQAVINEIDGMDSSGTTHRPVPTILGMNFQAVSVGEKLPIGGYVDAAGTPSKQLNDAIMHTDESIGRIVSELSATGRLKSTLIIISAKHGQSPIDKAVLQMEGGGNAPDQSVQDPSGFIALADPTVDTGSGFTNPNSGSTLSTNGHFQTDDVGLLWLENQSASNIAAVVAELTLTANAKAMHADMLPPRTIFGSNVNSGAALAAIYGDPTDVSNPVAVARAPNVIIQPNHGVIYSGSSKKIAEHGGGSTDDTNVALLVYGLGIGAGMVHTAVKTTQIAPSILCALGLDPEELQAVRREATKALPGVSCEGEDEDNQ